MVAFSCHTELIPQRLCGYIFSNKSKKKIEMFLL